jgi:hypothetical protein
MSRSKIDWTVGRRMRSHLPLFSLGQGTHHSNTASKVPPGRSCLSSKRRSVVAEEPCSTCRVSRQLLNRHGPQRVRWHVTGRREREYHVLLSCVLTFSPATRRLAAVIGLSGPIRESIDPCRDVTCHLLCLNRFVVWVCNMSSSRSNARGILNAVVAGWHGMRRAFNHAVIYTFQCTSMVGTSLLVNNMSTIFGGRKQCSTVGTLVEGDSIYNVPTRCSAGKQPLWCVNIALKRHWRKSPMQLSRWVDRRYVLG